MICQAYIQREASWWGLILCMDRRYELKNLGYDLDKLEP